MRPQQTIITPSKRKSVALAISKLLKDYLPSKFLSFAGGETAGIFFVFCAFNVSLFATNHLRSSFKLPFIAKQICRIFVRTTHAASISKHSNSYITANINNINNEDNKNQWTHDTCHNSRSCMLMKHLNSPILSSITWIGHEQLKMLPLNP